MNLRAKILLLILLLVTAGSILIWRVRGSTGLLAASGNVHAASVAMDLGADFNQPVNGSYPIITAVQARDEAMVKKLLAAKVNLNVVDGLSATPLIWAAETNQTAMAGELITAGANVNAVDNEGSPALIHAVRNQNFPMADLLIKSGAKLNLADQYGQTALIMAAAKNDTRIARLLVANGADITITDKNGHPAVDFLPQGHDPSLAPLLRCVYFVPFGEAPSAEIQELVGYYRDHYNLEIRVLPAIGPRDGDIDPQTQQLVAENAIASIQQAYQEYSGNSSAVLIGITSQDMYPQEKNWRFAFGWREQNGAIVSTARMGLHYPYEPADQANEMTRLRKVVTKDLAIYVFEKQQSDDPKSVLYSGISGIQELDAVGEDF